ncbi:hypothetical protein DSECCO2_120170 [anaerobic digester metagenome]
MYSTVKEMHIALDLGLQHIDSNRKQSVDAFYKDMALNYAVLQFVELRTSEKSNRKREGAEETIKRYDDIRELKRHYFSNIIIDNDEHYVILPSNYYKFGSAQVDIKYSKFNLPITNANSQIKYKVIPFLDDNNSSATYANFKISKASNVIFDIKSYVNFPILYNRDSKFMIINLVIDTLLNKGIEVYWENYNNNYYPESFIIIDNSNDKYTLNYGNVAAVSTTHNYSYDSYTNVLANRQSPVELISSADLYEMPNNHYQDINRHRKPYGYIEGTRLYIKGGAEFVPLGATISYYKKPRLINHITNQMCDITVNREIVDMAIQRLKAIIKDEGYQALAVENQIIE